MKRAKQPRAVKQLTNLELDAIWRDGDTTFIGPVEPPMVKWLRTREPWPWEVEMAARRRVEPQQMEFQF